MLKNNWVVGDAGHVEATNAMATRINRQIWAEDYDSVQSAIDNAPDWSMVMFTNREIAFPEQVIINKPLVLWLAGTIVGPSSGYIFKITSSDVTIRGRVRLVVSGGGAGGIQIVDSDRVELSNIYVDLMGIQGAIGLHHLGGWYANVSNVHIDKGQESILATGIKIQCTNSGDGNRGVYVSMYSNCTCRNLVIDGANPKTVTTVTIVNLDAMHIVSTLARCITLLQPVIQQDKGTHITLRYTSAFTAVGGDFEGSGVIYDITPDCRGIVSLNNNYSGFTGTYLLGGPGSNGTFADYSENFPVPYP